MEKEASPNSCSTRSCGNLSAPWQRQEHFAQVKLLLAAGLLSEKKDECGNIGHVYWRGRVESSVLLKCSFSKAGNFQPARGVGSHKSAASLRGIFMIVPS